MTRIGPHHVLVFYARSSLVSCILALRYARLLVMHPWLTLRSASHVPRPAVSLAVCCQTSYGNSGGAGLFVYGLASVDFQDRAVFKCVIEEDLNPSPLTPQIHLSVFDAPAYHMRLLTAVADGCPFPHGPTPSLDFEFISVGYGSIARNVRTLRRGLIGGRGPLLSISSMHA